MNYTGLERRKKFKMLLTLFLVLGISGCKDRPPLTICFFSSQEQVMKCTDPEGQDFDCDLQCMNKFAGMPPRDFERLLQYVTDLEKKAAQGSRIELATP